MNNYRKTVKDAATALLAGVVLLTAVPGINVTAAEKSSAVSEKEVLSTEDFYEMDGGDAEYWKHYDAEGNPLVMQDNPPAMSSDDSGQTDDEVTITSPYTDKEYSVLSGYTISHGIDVSKYNNQEGDIDWGKVRNDGIESVIIRCAYRGYGSEGNLAEDPYFEENIEDTLAAGLKVGVYIYSQAITEAEAVEEAKKCLDLCGEYLTELDMPIVMDVEYANPGGEGAGGRLYDADLTNAEQTAICEAFCETVENAGYQAMVYANKSMLSNNMNPSDLTDAGYKIWLARYNSYAGYEDSPYMMWQYSSSGSVSGISGNVDVDFVYTPADAAQAPDWNSISVRNNNKVDLSWKIVPGKEGYEIQRSTDQNNWSELVTLKAAAAVGYTDASVESGNRYFYRIRTYYTENGEKKYGSWSEQVSVSVESANVFADVSEEDYYYEPVQWAYKNGITSGVDETHFAPKDVCTRGQVVTFLWRAEGKPEVSSVKCPFVDIEAGEYYYDAVLWAYEKGITSGKDAEHFDPYGTVTRGEFVTFLHRAEGEPASTIQTSPFTDVKDDMYYAEAVLWAYENGITEGVDETHFEPDTFCIRGDVVTFLYRAYH